MLVLSPIPVLLALAALAAAAPRSTLKLKEHIDVPRNWVRVADAPAEHTIALRIALPQSNFDALEAHLYEASDPDHARYGQHLSKEEVERLVAPRPESLAAVQEWLAGHGIPKSACTHSPAKDWVKVDVPVSKAEAMLDTKYSVWQHTVDGDVLVRTTSYSLPEHLHAHVELIQPTTMFGRFRSARSLISVVEDAPESSALKSHVKIVDPASGTSVDASCNQTITISCIQQLYNAVGYVPQATKVNKIGITGYLEEYANFADLKSFYKDQRPEAVNSTFKVELINGGLDNQTLSAAGAEANLDVQFAYGISFPTPGTFWSTGGRPPFKADTDTPTDTNEPYTEWLDFVLSHPDLPQTVSTSYGDDEQTVPKSFAKRACKGFAQLGARGTSLMFSSGDGGVGDGDSNPATQSCFTNDGKNATKFIPLFPASCPFVTAVGGTQHFPEVAVSRFFSGGGFSNYFSRPAFQEKAVTGYLSALPKGTYKGLFNPAGRGIPDVAAQGDFFRIFLSGQAVLIGGTSASSPTFAGVVSLLNDARLARGLPSLGWLNPLLYSKGVAGLNDITVGHNSGCGTTGFNVTKGWDPVTGLGTPNFGKLKDIVLSV
ncbi:serine protease S53 [Heterobasidion irregulare TC 32-1]|uniref:tripeptidyl-peptidase II n=1 Tax=Heterobasidion irregulare (strain TC 32-1) TaxID=747525 RepID=W4KF31_HETIT|nr:serine protease S53 [Heterobasidion irregulare TC 32-1]ETW83671.1 serine protease S53 [Heterobasidion irregulare TC 32-1]